MSKTSLVIPCAALILIGSVLFARNVSEVPIDQPAAIAAVAPTLPPIARQARVESEVKVEVKIDENGHVQSTRVISGHPLLEKASEIAAGKWKFSPIGQGSAIRTVQLTFNFDFVDKDKLAPDSTITFIPPYEVEVRY